jgi:adenine-specific DNA-methyltransferase
VHVVEAKARKARGAFFTPPGLSRFVSEWAVRTPADSVLEPSCGEASFLLAAGARLRELAGGAAPAAEQLRGVEVHAESAREAERLMASEGLAADVTVSDFFDVSLREGFDVVLGNPPYVRYQAFSGAARAKAQMAALAQGVKLTGLASSWAAFVVHAAGLLRSDGRLGLVLPAELLTVNYAADVRRFLMERFESVRILTFEERVFPGVLEEVVLLLAEGSGGTDRIELFQARGERDLTRADALAWVASAGSAGKWTPAFLDDDAGAAYAGLVAHEGFGELSEWGRAYLGAVTGNNRYFTLSNVEARELGLRPPELRRLSPPGSRHLRGLTFTDAAWNDLAAEGKRTLLFYPKDKPSSAARRYIEAGERDGVDQAFKCRVRTPWWRVPVVDIPDCLLTYMNHDTPRLVANRAGVLHLNSVHGVRFHSGLKRLGMDVLPLASLNTFTLLGAEMVGRSYGGGMLKVEPREAMRLPMPAPAVADALATELRALRPQLGTALRGGDLEAIVTQVDRLLLLRHLRLPRKDLEALRRARTVMFERRQTRGKGSP